MAGTPSPGIYGTSLAFTINSTDQMADIQEAVLSSDEKDADDATFAETAGGQMATYKLKVTAIQSMAATSFHQFLWIHSGETVPFKFSPTGNLVAAADNPVWSGTVKLPTPPDVGGAADPKKEKRYTFEVEMTSDDVVRTISGE